MLPLFDYWIEGKDEIINNIVMALSALLICDKNQKVEMEQP